MKFIFMEFIFNSSIIYRRYKNSRLNLEGFLEVKKKIKRFKGFLGKFSQPWYLGYKVILMIIMRSFPLVLTINR